MLKHSNIKLSDNGQTGQIPHPSSILKTIKNNIDRSPPKLLALFGQRVNSKQDMQQNIHTHTYFRDTLSIAQAMCVKSACATSRT